MAVTRLVDVQQALALLGMAMADPVDRESSVALVVVVVHIPEILHCSIDLENYYRHLRHISN